MPSFHKCVAGEELTDSLGCGWNLWICVRHLLSPLRGFAFICGLYPRLTPWAALLRRSAAFVWFANRSFISCLTQRISHRLRPVRNDKEARTPLLAHAPREKWGTPLRSLITLWNDECYPRSKACFFSNSSTAAWRAFSKRSDWLSRAGLAWAHSPSMRRSPCAATKRAANSMRCAGVV